MKQDWMSYDAAAARHDQPAVAAMFAPPAADLVAKAALQRARTILDVGAGTGTVALLAARSACAGALIAGVDPSFHMLRAARRKGLVCAAVGALPGLPFADQTFDRVLAGFVLSHLPSLSDGLRDMIRVLRRRGILGVTTWGALPDEARDRWLSLANSFVGADDLDRATRKALPWEESLRQPVHLRQALEDAGLHRVEVDRAEYRLRVTIADFLTGRENSLQGRFVRHALSDPRWEQFRRQAAAELHRVLPDPIEQIKDAYIAIGHRA
jgi:SAM-dependent methyltransferase